MKRTLSTLLLLLLLVSCQKEQESVSPEEQARQDSLALHVGVLPVMDCLPIYYAKQMGIFRETGIDVRLVEYMSQMDCDTAMQRGWVELAYGDMARTLLMQDNMRVIMSLPGHPVLITARSKRIRQLKHLNERMVALDRLSAADYWSDQLMTQAGLDQTAIYRPQVNDIRLRTSMLTEQLLDAALLPEPYATQATMAGNRRLYTPADSTTALAGIVMPKTMLADTTRTAQIRKFIIAYDKAADLLNSNERNSDSLCNILQRNYSLPQHLADSLHIPTFAHAQRPKTKDIDTVARWLKTRERSVPKSCLDSLICTRFVERR